MPPNLLVGDAVGWCGMRTTTRRSWSGKSYSRCLPTQLQHSE